MSSWTLHRLTDPSAACLDGHPGAFYHRPNSEARGRWLIYIQGGGWCFSDDDCALRAASSLGSAERLPPQPSAPELTAGGVLSADCAHNAEFCKYNAAILHYCDGAVQRQREPDGAAAPARRARARRRRPAACAPAWRRRRRATPDRAAGRRVGAARHAWAGGRDRRAARRLLRRRPGGAAPRGGGARRRAAVGRAAPTIWRRELLGDVWARGAVGDDRRAPARDHEPRRPAHRLRRGGGLALLGGHGAVEALPADLPAFVEQSTLDRWVSYCELGADTFSGHYLRNCAAGEWANCLQFTRPFAHGRLGRKCTDAQRAQLEAHQRAAADALRATTALRRPKYGGFVHGCHDHCPATRSGSWEHTKVGDVALADAVRRWWAGDATVHDPGCIADFAGGCAPSCWGLQPWPDPRPLVERQIKALGGAARGGRRARRLRREDSLRD